MNDDPNDRLSVWNERRQVGWLWRDRTGVLGFRYDSEWVEAGFAISRLLPLRHDPFLPDAGLAHNFFANLLPEGGARQAIVRDLKIADSDFELLRAIGGECAGALSLLPFGEAPSGEKSYAALSLTELTHLVKSRGHIYATFSPPVRPRLSLAGAQDKTALLVREGRYFLPQGEAPSSHILKFELARYRHVPAYEVFTTMLARAASLPVVEADLVEISGHSCSLTKRYDRHADAGGEIQRLHQEDFCQALGYPSGKKYQDSGGPSFEDCFAMVRGASSEPATDARNLLRWQVFNVLAGNSDGHAKNLSILHLDRGAMRLAPFYDLVCTRGIDRIDPRLAFGVGGERDPGRIGPAQWDRLAVGCDIREQYLRQLVKEVATFLLDRLRPTMDSFEELFGSYPALQRVEKVVRKQCQRAGSS